MGRVLLATKDAPALMSTFESESVDAWRQHLSLGNIEEAYRCQQSAQQREYLAGLMADQLFEKGKHAQAAKVYVESDRSFEETCLKFMRLESKQGEASLEKYLSFCLEKYNSRAAQYVLSADDYGASEFNKERTQRTVLATWLLEIKLSMLEDAQNQALVKRDRAFQDAVTKMELDFFQFINKEIDNLDKDTIFQLL